MIDLIRAELLRIRTTRLAMWMALGTAAGVVLTVGAAISTAGRDGLPGLDTTEGVRNVLNGATAATTAALIFGIVALTGEFRHRTAATTFLVTPDRRRVVAAKIAATGLAGLVYSLGAAVLTLTIAIPWMAAKQADLTLFSDDVGVVLGGAVIATILYAAIGVGIGALVRNQTQAVIIALVWSAIVEGVLVTMLPDVGRWLPGGAANALTASTTAEGALLPVLAGGLLLAAYTAVIAVAGTRVTVRRDVP